MTFDCSRFSFDPWNDYLGVIKQQGRVDLDSDWNEFQAELARRIQAGTMDIVGRAVVPVTTPYGFKIGASVDASGQQHITIGAGRMYVDGLLAENHGTLAAASWDPSLAELSCAPAGGAEIDVDFTQQPYLPGATLPTGSTGPFLAYLDIWRRPVSYLDDPNLVETAVGVDTTGRMQTVWQVRLLDVSAAAATLAGGVTCATPDSAIPNWQQLIQPSGARLTTGTIPSSSSGPCSLAPAAGYTGLENQLYRVQIHQGGSANATFKWSRDNASLATAVTAIGPATSAAQQPSSQLTVQSTGRDNVLCFIPGNWIEIIDDYTELNGQSGEVHLIDTNGVNKTANTITLATAVSAGFAQRLSDPTIDYHTRIIRWDQAGQVFQGDGVTLWTDLGAAGSTGLIPVPPPGTALILEGGVTVAFDTAGGGSFLTGDYWNFAARTATGAVGPLTEAPPFGIHHHYARLSVVTFPGTASDCRITWPPPPPPCCGCTISIGPADLTANLSLQTVLDNFGGQPGPTVICLQPGTYVLTAPLRLTAAHSNITLQACQTGTVFIQALAAQANNFTDGLVVLDTTASFTLSGLSFVVPLAGFAAAQFAGLPVTSLDPDVQAMLGSLSVSIAVRPFNCTALVIEKCLFDLTPMQTAPATATPFGVGVFAGGQCTGWRLTGNTFRGAADFAAGVMLTSSVGFAAPAAASPPVSVTGGQSLGAESGRVSRELANRTTDKVSAADVSAGGAVTADASPTLNRTLVSRLNTIISQGSANLGLASQGGTVIPCTLSGATFTANNFSDLTLAVLSVAGTAAATAGSGLIQLTGNTVTGGGGGVWLISPLQASALINDPLNISIVIGLSVALGYPVPQGDATPAVTVAAAPQSFRIWTGPGNLPDTAGTPPQWTPDAQTPGVAISGISGLNQNLHYIANASTAQQLLYQYERYGQNFSYTFTGLTTGYYQVTLKFAELFDSTPNYRLFNVAINGVQVLTSFDIYADVGNIQFWVDDKIFPNVVPVGGQIVIQFTSTTYSPDQHAKISGVQIDAQWSDALANPASLQPAVGNARISELQNFFAQLLALSQQGLAGATMVPRLLRITDNEMQGLSSVPLVVLGDDTVQNAMVSSLMMSGNRMDSSLSSSATTDQTQGQVPASFAVYLYFSNLTTITAVTRCVVSGNMLGQTPNAPPATGWRFALELDDSALPNALVSVMGNVIGGPLSVLPQRPAPYIDLPDYAGFWNFLNTT